MKPDPDFPDRPTHRDFDLLSKIAIEVDATLPPDGTVSFGDMTQGIVDPDSLVYIAEQRTLALPGQSVQMRAAGMAGIIDGFIMGYKYARQSLIQAEDDWIAPDGNRRTKE